MKMLDIVGLTEFANHYPNQLSGGMQQRVGIARALAIQPQILLMDEPFSALDEFTKEKLHEDLLRIWAKTNKTIIFVTHNIQEAVFLSSRICVLLSSSGKTFGSNRCRSSKTENNGYKGHSGIYRICGKGTKQL